MNIFAATKFDRNLRVIVSVTFRARCQQGLCMNCSAKPEAMTVMLFVVAKTPSSNGVTSAVNVKKWTVSLSYGCKVWRLPVTKDTVNLGIPEAT